MPSQPSFVHWFRGSAPYIHAHRNQTFVVSFSGEAVASPDFTSTVHDFALLNSLGIRLVLVHGIRPQIEQRLAVQGIESRYHRQIRITDDVALQCSKEAAGTVRVELEALLSMGLPSSPMAGSRMQVASGNFVTARPLGVIDGIDYCHTGAVRRIDAVSIREKLDQNNVILVSPVGYSPTGEVFNLSAESVATHIAVALNAGKLILLSEADPLCTESGKPLKQLTTGEATELLQEEPGVHPELCRNIETAISACESGVSRTHIVCRRLEGALLQELFTRDGRGTLISSAPYESLRQATLQDVAGILDLITPMERDGTLVPRSRERLEMEIGSFLVIDRDGLIVGCAALYDHVDHGSGELACIAAHSDYRSKQCGKRLLEAIESRALGLGLKTIFVLTTQTSHWFMENGFNAGALTDLPPGKQKLYNFRRNSKVLLKKL